MSARPDLIPHYRAKLAAEMPLGRPSDVNVTSVTDRIVEERIHELPSDAVLHLPAMPAAAP